MNNEKKKVKENRREFYLCNSEIVAPIYTSQIKNLAIKNLIEKVLKVVCKFAIEIDDDKLILHDDNLFHEGYSYAEGEWSISELEKL